MSFLIQAKAEDCDFLERIIRTVGYRNQAATLDALLNNVIALQATTTRLYNGLLAINQSKDYTNTILRGLMNDCWFILDNLNRAFSIATKGGIKPSAKDELLIIRLSRVRNSFQHLEDRISAFFSKTQGTIYGDLTWKYRPSLDVEAVGIMYMGLRFGQPLGALDYGPIDINSVPPELINETGVYDLRVYFLEGNRKGSEHNRIVLSVDELVTLFNSLIDMILRTHRQAFANILAEDTSRSQTINGVGPTVFELVPAKNLDNPQ